MRLRILAAAALAACLGVMLGGCGSSRTFTYRLDMPRAADGGPGLLAVDVENFNGTVELRAGDRWKDIRVDGRVEVDHEIPGPVSAGYFDSVAVSAALEGPAEMSVLRVRSTSPKFSRERSDHRVKLTITLPSAEGVRIDNWGGLVLVVNTSGATQIANRLGAVELRTNHAMTEPVTITTSEGSIYYQVPEGSTGVIDFETLNGSAYIKDRKGGTDRTYSTQRVVQTVLNNGDNPVVCRTNNGYIRAWVMDDPVAFTRSVREPPVDPREWIFPQGSQRFKRNLPDDAPPDSTGTRSVPLW
ncbi:MAG: hypothetical protein IBJ11_12035 [Phycisphaerales bacterium]|nr:hypothetical protein [Phycisphaerales bacterium]